MSEADEGGRKRRTVYPGIAAIMAIAIGVNALGVLSIDPLASLMIESDVLAAIDAISSHGLARFLNVILPFSLFGIFLLFYLLPIAHAFSGRKRADPQSIKVARRLLRTPTVIALVTGAAWLVSLPVVVIGWSMLDFDLESRFYLQYTMHSLTLFGFSFVIAYYGVEVIVQRYIAPRVFSENQALQGGFALRAADRSASIRAGRISVLPAGLGILHGDPHTEQRGRQSFRQGFIANPGNRPAGHGRPHSAHCRCSSPFPSWHLS
jgi:hypothetical protein